RVSPAVLGVVVLSRRGEVVHFVAKHARKRERLWFRQVFTEKIMPDMDLENLPPDQHKHLHKVYDGKTYLLSYIRRKSSGSDFSIVLNMNIPYLAGEIFREEFKPLKESAVISVMDETGRVLYGSPVVKESSLVFEERFPTTLYKWRLQVAPRQIHALMERAHVRRVTDLYLVSTAVGVIMAGLAFLFVAIRKERRANQLKSVFISNVSHELKTPLSLIHMFGELLALGRTQDSKTATEYARIITRESERLTALIENVLDFARIERGKEAYEFAVGNLGRVVERVAELSSYRAEQAGMKLHVALEENIPDTTIDEGAMTLLLLNLVENAVKHGAKKNGKIEVSLHSDVDELLLRVADEGPGIPQDEQRLVFERFYRGKAVPGKATRGSGIGLSLVKNIAIAHGGKVSVRSEPGKGAAFEVRVPIGFLPK
ncbi:MAG: HAMP domain-containing sensor histidine kinase, partial [Pseudomonadota bacterium]